MASVSIQYLPQFHRCSSPPCNYNRISILRQQHDGVDRRSAMRPSNLQQITTAVNQSHRNQIQFHLKNTNYTDLSFNFNNYFISTMNDSSDSKNKSCDGVKDMKDTKETEKSPKIPPPPEKPLAGDCCGSGCVRCVWDVYYEELEEYNKIIEEESESKV